MDEWPERHRPKWSMLERRNSSLGNRNNKQGRHAGLIYRTTCKTTWQSCLLPVSVLGVNPTWTHNSCPQSPHANNPGNCLPQGLHPRVHGPLDAPAVLPPRSHLPLTCQGEEVIKAQQVWLQDSESLWL